MRVYNVRINGRKNPVGIHYSGISCSWKVEHNHGKKQKNVRIQISMDDEFTQICFSKEGERLSSLGEMLEFASEPCTRYYIKVEVTAETGESAVSELAFFETGIDKWHGVWIGMEPEDDFHPQFIQKIQLNERIRSARLYISGAGIFEAYLNGEKVGNEYLAPFINDYKEGLQYITYDISRILRQENEISVVLGNGWYKGRLGYTGLKEVYGNRFQMIAEIRILYKNGDTQIIATDRTWKYRSSSIQSSDIYDGEVIDELLEETEKTVWKHAVELTDQPLPIERYSLPLKEMECLPVKELIYTPAGEWVLDFGQNMAGFVRFTGEMKRGETLKLSFGEILQEGNFYNENYRTAKAEFLFTSNGKRKTVRPHFVYYGFRYVRVEGLEQVNPQDFEGVVLYSEMDRTGIIHTSHPLLNRLYENTVWGLKGNFLDMPTDCPQRDERLGWTGDAQVFAGTASYHMDTRAFYAKYLHDLRNDQIRNEGKVAMYLPNLMPGLTCAVWGDAATIIPTVLYRHYGDREALTKQYPLMTAWVDYIHEEDRKRGEKNLWDFGFQLGDWLALDGITEQSMQGGTDTGFIASIYYYGSTNMTAEAARSIGKEEDVKQYRKLAEKIKEAILYQYFTPAGKLAIDTQTAYYIALYFGVYREKEILIEDLKKRLKKDCYKIKSGFAGGPIMCNVLADVGLVDLAYDFLFNEEYPGWLFEVNLGATTIWERWNSVLSDGTISGIGMNSLNHYAYGSVAEFLYRHGAGIQPATPGFTRARIAPKLTSYLQELDCTYDSASGKYEVRWKILEGKRAKLDVHVPFQTEADIILPDKDKTQIHVDAGDYSYVFETERDYRCLFSMDSRLEQLKKNQEVMQFIEEKCPVLTQMMRGGDAENLNKTLNELSESVFSGVSSEELSKVREIILTIKN